MEKKVTPLSAASFKDMTQSVFAPSGLLTDLLEFPERTRIATRRPTFGWMVNGGNPGPAQTAYQILLASNCSLLETDQGDVWDSGRVQSAQSLHLGPPELSWGKSYIWKVRTWDTAGSASPWSAPQIFRIAEAQPAEPMSIYPLEFKEVVPSRIVPQPGSSWFIDFGRAAFGWLEITAAAGTRDLPLLVRLGEKSQSAAIDRSPPGTVRYVEASVILQPGKAVRVEFPKNDWNTKGDAVLLPPELGVVFPFRYAEIEGLPADFPVQDAVRQQRVQYPFNETACLFESSDNDLNRLWEFCRYSIQATTFAGYYVDGDRERIPYEADAYINQLGHYAADREFSLARRSHEYLLKHPTWPTEWKQFSIMLAWLDYEATGDLSSLSRCYDQLKAEKLFLGKARGDGLLDTSELRDLVDWPQGERDDFDFRPVNTVVNAFHYHTLGLMGKMASALGKNQDAKEFDDRALLTLESFQRAFWHEKNKTYVDGEGSSHSSQHANLFALAFGLVPDTQKTNVVAYLKSRGMACSVYAAQFLLDGLFEAGESDYAIGLMLSKGLRSWSNMLDQDATITWEAWDQSFKPNQDWNHAWGAAPINCLSRYVLGVRPLEPGYAKIKVCPQLGPLKEVRGIVPSIRGPIHVHAWRDEKDLIQSEVSVPANVERIL